MINNIKEVQMGVSKSAKFDSKKSGWPVYAITGAISAKRQVFAVGTSVDGKIKWDFKKDVLNSDAAALRNNIAVHPEYYDYVNVKGVDILCGRMGRPRGSNASALFTVLDGDGQIVEDRLIDPLLVVDQSLASSQVDSTAQSLPKNINLLPANIYRCATWGDGVILIGSAGSSLWVTRLNAELKIQWQQVFARNKDAPDPALSAREIGINVSAERAVISFTDNASSEILILTSTGSIKSRTILPGRFIALENTKPGVIVKFIGRSQAPGLTLKWHRSMSSQVKSRCSLPKVWIDSLRRKLFI